MHGSTIFGMPFIALDGNGRLIGARTVYTSHDDLPSLQYHPE
ncbi:MULTISPECIES: hypothetical protein [Enterobacteriaceae]|nr:MULTISPECIES: hypothetical protein [Enterobacteriaceae]MCU4029184.1 hypothetical protein [Enterobacter roggenkampii]MEB2419507.1 hypothetical protein [Citrobacter sp. R-1.5.2]